MSMISCPKCSQTTKQAGFPGWVLFLSICFFPLGLLALLAGRKITVCQHCQHTFQG